MLHFTEKLHAAKTDFLAGGYEGITTEIVNFYGTDTVGIEKEILAVADIDYNIVAAKDNPPAKQAWNSFTKALRKAGECLPDNAGGKLVFKFSSCTNDGVKCRTVAISYMTQKQVDIAVQREADDAATAAQREADDAEIIAEIQQAELLKLTPLDIFLKLKKEVENAYSNHDVKDILSAGMAWYTQQEKIAAQEAQEAEKGKKAISK